MRLPPGARLRRAFLRRAFEAGIGSTNRGDYEAGFGFFNPDYELIPPREIVALGSFPEKVRGRHERTRLEEQWRADWGEFRYEADELVDLGDRLLVLGRIVGTGSSSGAAFVREWADMFTLWNGLVSREQVFLSHAEALEPAGLRK